MILSLIEQSFASTDLGEAEALVRRLYPVASIRDAERSFRFSQAARGEGGVSLARFQCSSPACFEVDFGDVAAFGLLLGGDYTATSADVAMDTRAPFVFQHGVGRSESSEMDLLMVNVEWSALELDDRDGGSGNPGFRSSRCGSPELERLWRRTVLEAAKVLWDEEAFRQPVVRSAVLDLVRITAATAFPRAGVDSGPSRVAPSTMRRAQQYIDDHAHEPIGTADIAAAARLSERGLSAAFKREFQQTPRGYLQQVRLRGARAALQAGEAGETSVAAIAAAWGFTHMGRFSQRYRREFGVYPSGDLRR